ncbi:ScbA/BarX family gamma-butyrolactone biosynthesis protein [Streptomyces sp. NPDC052396]|uniref:ScbA/BarX family gamma-butyrolactone biosynthesis protein n=1 Tax=Streptomyces sp. NPDC052396 TaxID=3365689 RepID=UPI0037D28841
MPRLTTTVPREFVHRAAVAEVLLTGWRRLGDTRFAVRAQWPRGHSFFTPVLGTQHDPMLIAETVRQIGSLLSHAEFGVPLDHQFVMWHLDYRSHPEHLAVGWTPAELELLVDCSELRWHGDSLAGMRYDVVIRRDGAVAATGSASLSCTSPRVYRRLRGARRDRPPADLGSPVYPHHVGRASAFDVVLSPAEAAAPGRWRLRADVRHPILFDHPVDHIPGMVLLEAARQAVLALEPAAPLCPVTLSSSFRRYAELSSPCWIEAERGPADASGACDTRVTGHQDGELLFSCAITSMRRSE